MTAQEAVQSGFANGIIEGLNDTDHWPDLSKIPAIRQLLNTDYRTLVNCKQLINAARDNQKIEEQISREAQALCDTLNDPEFLPKFITFVQKALKVRKKE